MKNLKWSLLLVLVFHSIGWASVDPNIFRNILAIEPTVSPEQLEIDLDSTPVMDRKINDLFRYQVYKLGIFNRLHAVYFKGDHIVANAPYDSSSNIKILLQLGAISQDEYNRDTARFQRKRNPRQTEPQRKVPQLIEPQQIVSQQTELQQMEPQQTVPQKAEVQQTEPQPTDEQQDQVIEQEIDNAQQQAQQAEQQMSQ